MRRDFVLPFVIAVILPLKRHPVFGHVEDAVIGESHAVRVAAKILSRAAEGRLGVNDPLGIACQRLHVRYWGGRGVDARYLCKGG